MKTPALLLLLATLVSCAEPASLPIDEATVVEPGVACRASQDGSPLVAERGIGGTGAPARTQIADRGIGGTGIVGVVTGFASICVDGLEVRFDKSVPVSINGAAATTGQLRVGQLVVINAGDPPIGPESLRQARMISVRYEVSGPIEAVDVHAGALIVAGQRVTVSPRTWVAGRFGVAGIYRGLPVSECATPHLRTTSHRPYNAWRAHAVWRSRSSKITRTRISAAAMQ